MTLRFRCRGRCQDRVERTGKWVKVEDVVSPRLSAVLVCVCVAERRWAVSVTRPCSVFVGDMKNTLAWSAAESRMQCGEAVVPASWPFLLRAGKSW